MGDFGWCCLFGSRGSSALALGLTRLLSCCFLCNHLSSPPLSISSVWLSNALCTPSSTALRPPPCAFFSPLPPSHCPLFLSLGIGCFCFHSSFCLFLLSPFPPTISTFLLAFLFSLCASISHSMPPLPPTLSHFLLSLAPTWKASLYLAGIYTIVCI